MVAIKSNDPKSRVKDRFISTVFVFHCSLSIYIAVPLHMLVTCSNRFPAELEVVGGEKQL